MTMAVSCGGSWHFLDHSPMRSPLYASTAARLHPPLPSQARPRLALARSGAPAQQAQLQAEEEEDEEEDEDGRRATAAWHALDRHGGASEVERLAIAAVPLNMTRRCRALMKRIICRQCGGGVEVSVASLLESWVRIMKPRRADWLVVLREMKRTDSPLLLEVMKYALAEESFEVNIRDYTKIIDLYAKSNRLLDAENAFLEMNTRGFTCDQVTLTVLVNMYSKTGNFERAKEVFEEIRLLGQPVDKRAYGAMIMTYIREGKPELGEDLLREMDNTETYACKEIYKALLRSYSTNGDADGAQRVFNMIQLAGIVPDARICALLINAYCVSGRIDDARSTLENMRKACLPPNDKCVTLMLEAYEKENKLTEAMSLLTELEKDGTAVGKEVSDAMAQWLNRLGLTDEAKQLTIHQQFIENSRMSSKQLTTRRRFIGKLPSRMSSRRMSSRRG